MKKNICLILVAIMLLSLTACAEADAIKNGIKDKLPKPEKYEIIEPVVDKPNIAIEDDMTWLVVQEVKTDKNVIIAVVDGTETLYSIPNWFGTMKLEPGTYILVEHAEQSLQTSPLQFGFIYSMCYYTQNGLKVEGIKP